MFSFVINNKSIIAISDTHGMHRKLQIPKCDVLIHCGDACTDGDESMLADFFEWYASQHAPYKIFIHGNHDYPFVFEPDTIYEWLPDNVIYMNNRHKVVAGIHLYGLDSSEHLHVEPALPYYPIDLLISHIPPLGILDDNLGCTQLSQFVKKLKPRYHTFGHIHQCGGSTIKKSGIIYANVSEYHRLESLYSR